MRQIAIITIAVSGTLFAGTNEWTRVGPEGGRVVRLAVDPHIPSTIYAGTCSDLFKTVNGGASWTAVNLGLPLGRCIDKLVIDPHNTGTVYARSNCEIYTTTDGGASWRTINSVPDVANCIVSLAIDTRNPATLYAGGNGLFKTTDGGSSWTQVTSGFQSGDVIRLVEVDPQRPDTLYAVGFRGLFRSTDGGASWSPANSGLPPNIETLLVDPQASGTLYASNRYASNRSQLFKSTDGGASWSDASFGLPPAPPPSLGYRELISLAVNSQAPAVLYSLIAQHFNGSPDSFFLLTSTDGGVSWSAAMDPLLAANDLNTITPDPQDAGTLYLGTNQGVLKSTDGGRNWNSANSGLGATAIRQVVLDEQNAGTIYAVNGTDRLEHGTRLFKSTDAGKSWVPSDVGLPSYVYSLVAHPQDPRTLDILGRHQGGGDGLFKSDDAGASWSEIWADTLPATSVWPLVIDPQNPNNLYAGVTTCTGNCYPRIAKSIDAGYTWTESQASLKGIGCCSSVTNVAVDPQDSNILYAGTADFDGGGSGLWKSTDAGVSWVNLTIGGDISSIAIDPRTPGTIYASNDFLWKSLDGGQTWANLYSRLPACCGPIVIDPQNSDTLYYAGYDNGVGNEKVFKSTDAGANWTSVSEGLAGRVNSLAIDPQNPRTLYAGTSSGLFAITFATSMPEDSVSVHPLFTSFDIDANQI